MTGGNRSELGSAVKKCSQALIVAGMALASAALAAVERPRSPFSDIVIENGAVIAKLENSGRWTVALNQQPPRPARPEESFSLRADDSLKLSERHLSFTFKPSLAGKPRGLYAWSVFDKRSFGGQVEHDFFYLTASGE